MDFSAFNPNSSNSLNISARKNDVATLKRLIRKNNPNCVDNRGWTCLHEAAANDRYECIEIILEHPDCRPLAESYEGHTALYLAVRNKCSQRSIKYLLDNIPYIAQYASNEMVSPLHIACMQQNLELVQLLIEYDSILDLQDFDGDTPLHEAATKDNSEIVSALLHAGADPERKNCRGLTPFHMASAHGHIDNLKILLPFVTDIDDIKNNQKSSPLMIASQLGYADIVEYLLSKGANPNLKDSEGKTTLMLAVLNGRPEVFLSLLKVIDRSVIELDIFTISCKPLYFDINIVVGLLESDLGDEFFNQCNETGQDMNLRLRVTSIDIVPMYRVISSLHSFLCVAEYIFSRSPELFRRLLLLMLMRGVSVDALLPDECPPLVYLHVCEYQNSFDEMLRILILHGCNVDYISPANRSDPLLPDIIQVSLATGSKTIIRLLEYSIMCEPETLIQYVWKMNTAQCYNHQSFKAKLMEWSAEKRCLSHLKSMFEHDMTFTLHVVKSVCSLQHMSRLKIRQILRENRVNSTPLYLGALAKINLPHTLLKFIQYQI